MNQEYKELIKNLQESEEKNSFQSENKKPKKKILVFFQYIIALSFVIFVLFFVNNQISSKNGSSWINNIPIIGQIKTLVQGSSNPLKGEDRGRVNILLIGMGGKNHDGGMLADTIMVFSYDLNKKKASLFSIPRDLTVPIEKHGWRKINSVNSYAEMENAGSGGLATSQTVSSLVNAPIDYYVRVDFDGFEKIIDKLGGVEVYVDNTFDDYKYPIRGNEDNPNYNSRYEHLHFDQGLTKMDGSLALKYARSRHALGVEGTDFARAARQQKVIQAVKDKLLSSNTLLKPTVIAGIIDEIQNNISTNMKIWEISRLWTLVKDVKKEDIVSKVLSNSPEGLLTDATGSDGAYILNPRAGNFSEIQYSFNNIFNVPEELSVNKTAVIKEEKPTVKVLNGTWISGLAGKKAMELERLGFSIVSIKNCSKQDFEKTVIYDLSGGQKQNSLEVLLKTTKGNKSDFLPEWLRDDLKKDVEKNNTSVKPDFVVIFGKADENNVQAQ